MNAWKALSCPITDLRLDLTLVCGQSFRWSESSQTPGVWTSVLASRVCSLRQDDHNIFYFIHEPKSTLPRTIKNKSPCDLSDVGLRTFASKEHTLTEIQEESNIGHGEYDSVIKNYFQLEVDLDNLYSQWCKKDKHFRSVAQTFPGIRILRQDPVENLFSFICSSNNHISRISGMVEKLCIHFGDEVGTVDGRKWHSFPPIERLAVTGVEEKLRNIGFGYRAKYICETARYLSDHHDKEWLFSLREVPYLEAKQELMKLCGVGAKVADCVCLMSLNKHGAIPVDTHVWQIACRHYLPALKSVKNVTTTVYNQIGDHLRELWGSHAGWAQSVMFSADLRKFEDMKMTSPTETSRKDVAVKKKRHGAKVTHRSKKTKKQ